MQDVERAVRSPLVIVADENIPLLEQYFGGLGELRRYPGRQLTPAQVADADVLLVRSVTRVDAALLADSPVRFVGTCTIGTDHLDKDWLDRRGIRWCSAPGCNANSVVEYVFAALSELNVAWWQQTVGIIGCGNVGGHLYRQLRALGVSCVVYDPLLEPGAVPDLTDLATVLSAGIVCLHAPLTTSGPWPSHHLLNEDALGQLRPGAVLISAGRGAVVDNQALKRVLARRPDLRVVLDVWEPEPGLDPALLQQVQIGTPHIAGYSMDGKEAGTRMVWSALLDYLGLVADAPPSAPVPRQTCVVSEGLVSAGAVLAAAIGQAYAIRADDQRLRAAVAELPLAFDRLRKEYPERREFRHLQVQLPAGYAGFELDIGNKKVPPDTILAALGFFVVQEKQREA